MADAEKAFPPSKKRAAGREISKDNPGLDDDDDENVSEQELGTFKKASDEVLATRRIVKARRQTSSAAPTSNPFAGIRLVPPKAAAAASSVPEVVKGAEVAENKGRDVAGEVEEDIGDCNPNSTKEGNGLEKKETENLPGNEKIVAEFDFTSEKGASEVKDAVGIKSEVNDKKVEESGEPNKVEETNDTNEVEETDETSKVEETNDASKVDESVDASKVEESDDVGKVEENEAAGMKDQNKVNDISSGGAMNPFQQLSSSKNAFTGFTGSGFSGSPFSFNLTSSDGTAAGANSVPTTGLKSDQSLFGFGLSANNGNGSLFGTKDSSQTKTETSGGPSLQEVPIETGEENEAAVFSANSALFEYVDGGWKERGRGEVKVNVSTLEGSKARLVMRTKGNYRLILNASLYPEMKLTYMDKKGITFACINSSGEGKGALSTYALKFKDGSVADEFQAIVVSHKGTPTVLKTPENSPQ